MSYIQFVGLVKKSLDGSNTLTLERLLPESKALSSRFTSCVTERRIVSLLYGGKPHAPVFYVCPQLPLPSLARLLASPARLLPSLARLRSSLPHLLASLARMRSSLPHLPASLARQRPLFRICLCHLRGCVYLFRIWRRHLRVCSRHLRFCVFGSFTQR